jgi:hypothetical protein
MGQFLAIGLATNVGVSKKDTAAINLEQLLELMKTQLYFVPEIYNFVDENDTYSFSLKDEILSSQLIPLLSAVYPHLYRISGYYEPVLKKLRELPPSEWLKWAKDKPEEASQFDPYGMYDYLRMNDSTIGVYCKSLMISAEGKIVMEQYGRQFSFLKYSMMQAFQAFSLAGSLRLYITG